MSMIFHYIIAIYYHAIIFLHDILYRTRYKALSIKFKNIALLDQKINYVSGSRIYIIEEDDTKKILKGFDIFKLYNNEYKVLKNFNTDCFPKIYEKEKYFFIEEYIAGKSISSFMKESYGDNQQNIINQIVVILDLLYENNVIHRDIRPENIIVDLENKVHLIDFGCAINLNSNLFKFPKRVTNTLGDKYRKPNSWDDAYSFYMILSSFFKEKDLGEIKKRIGRLEYEIK